MATTLHQNHPITISYIEHAGSVQISPVFEPNRRHNEPQRQKCGPFRVKGRRKKHANDRTRTSLVPFFLLAGPLKATFEHHTGRCGADHCFEEGRVDVHSALVRHTRAHLQPETNGNTPQPIVRTRDLERLYSPCGTDEREKRRKVTTIAVEVDANRWTKLYS